MKRLIAISCAAVLLIMCASALAEVPQFHNPLFSDGKNALVYLASGEYERLTTLLPFSNGSPEASEWQDFAQNNFTTLANGVQTDYSVAYWDGSNWNLAIPVSEPNDDSVETLVLISADGTAFDDYRYATWGDVRRGYESADYAIWNREYVSGNPVVTSD